MVLALRNGQLPISILPTIPWDRNERVRFDALDDLIKLNEAFRLAFGHNLIINDSYRDLERQRQYYKNPPSGAGTAAWPGTSNHGWGLAVDLRLTYMEYQWMLAAAPAYRWNNPLWARDGRGIEEPWHWEHSATRNVVPDRVTVTTPEPQEEDDMFSDNDRKLLQQAVSALGDARERLTRLETKAKRQDLLFLYFRTSDDKPAVAQPFAGWYAIAPSDAVLAQHRWLMGQLGLVVDGTSVKDWDDIREKTLGVAPNGDVILDPEAFIERREWDFYEGGQFQPSE